MFNVLPGQGLGFSASHEIALGLGSMEAVSRDISGGGFWYPSKQKKQHSVPVTILDNPYAHKNDDNEVLELLMIFIGAVNG